MEENKTESKSEYKNRHLARELHEADMECLIRMCIINCRDISKMLGSNDADKYDEAYAWFAHKMLAMKANKSSRV